MDRISAESVEKGYADICAMTEPDAYRLSFEFQKDQLLLIAYLTAVDKDILNQEERELLFYLGAVAWKIMNSDHRIPPGADQERLLNIEAANQKIGNSLRAAETVTFTDVAKKLIKSCSQPEVFRYTVAALMDENNAENSVRDENLGIIMLNLKTVIEYLDR